MEEILLCEECDIGKEINPIKNKYVPPKCEHNKRQSDCIACGGSNICIHKKRKYDCKECGSSKFCIHGKNKLLCVDCDGSSICEHKKYIRNCKECGSLKYCEHGINKYICKECKGSGICEHNKNKKLCKECNGSGICEHNKNKRFCKECNGSGICEHNKIKYRCKECKGSGICEHNKDKRRCKECKGSGLCSHNKIKYMCIECKGSGICEHNKDKRRCKECKGSGICEHDKRKSDCILCKGSQICVHNKRKYYCIVCDGSALCKFEWCETTANKKYEGYCLFCYVNLFPDKPITRNYKTKEKDVVDRILKIFPDFTWILDKKIQDGCSRRRPDLLLDLGSHIIIVEIDENAHTDYDCSCENKRLMEISHDLNFRPIVFIRFNPDDYVNKEGNKIKSCWKLNRHTGLIVIDQKKIKEWDERINSLVEQINYWIKNPTEKTVEIVELFY